MKEASVAREAKTRSRHQPNTTKAGGIRHRQGSSRVGGRTCPRRGGMKVCLLRVRRRRGRARGARWINGVGGSRPVDRMN